MTASFQTAPPFAAASQDYSQAKLYIILNAGSGRRDTDATRETIESALTVAGRDYHLTLVEDPAQLSEIARETVAEAQKNHGIVVAAGGDGAINAIAQQVLGSGCALGVLPQGTFNYFGRTHGIPTDTAEAVQALLSAHIEPVQVGLVNDSIFLVNASLGLYPQLLEDREAYKQQYGRSRLVAMISGIATILREHRQLRISLQSAGTVRDMRTPMLFVGNNQLQLEQIGIPLAQALASGELAAIMPKPVGTLAMLGLMMRGIFGQLGETDNVVSFGFSRMQVKTTQYYPGRRVKVATDGEIIWLADPLEFRVSPEPLYLLKPATPATRA
jgi:diacylglycerol kinase family enzyme